MVAEVRPHAKKTRDFSMLVKVLDLLKQGEVSQSVTVIHKKFFFALQVLFNRFQSLPEIGIDSRVCEGDSPVADVAVEKLQLLPAPPQDKVVSRAFVVV